MARSWHRMQSPSAASMTAGQWQPDRLQRSRSRSRSVVRIRGVGPGRRVGACVLVLVLMLSLTHPFSAACMLAAYSASRARKSAGELESLRPASPFGRLRDLPQGAGDLRAAHGGLAHPPGLKDQDAHARPLADLPDEFRHLIGRNDRDVEPVVDLGVVESWQVRFPGAQLLVGLAVLPASFLRHLVGLGGGVDRLERIRPDLGVVFGALDRRRPLRRGSVRCGFRHRIRLGRGSERQRQLLVRVHGQSPQSLMRYIKCGM